jgi:hypothetical protein
MQEPTAAGPQAAMDKDSGDDGVGLPPIPQAHHYAPAYGHMMHPPPHMVLEHQFAQFGLQDNTGSDHTATSTNHATDSSENNDTEHGATNEGEESEGEPVKLFVGQVCGLTTGYWWRVYDDKQAFWKFYIFQLDWELTDCSVSSLSFRYPNL